MNVMPIDVGVIVAVGTAIAVVAYIVLRQQRICRQGCQHEHGRYQNFSHNRPRKIGQNMDGAEPTANRLHYPSMS